MRDAIRERRQAEFTRCRREFNGRSRLPEHGWRNAHIYQQLFQAIPHHLNTWGLAQFSLVDWSSEESEREAELKWGSAEEQEQALR